MPLRETKTVFYFTSSASRKAIRTFYDQLATQGVIPQGFPHHEEVHSGIGIFNHRTGKVEYVLEGSGNRDGVLVLYKNRESTINKLNNSGVLKSADDQSVQGHWTLSYRIKRYTVDVDIDFAISTFDNFFAEFNDQSAQSAVPYEVGRIDCQTVVHYLLRTLTGKEFASPHGKYTLGWGDGLQSPHELAHNESASSSADDSEPTPF
jgi:hypothetical protein